MPVKQTFVSTCCKRLGGNGELQGVLYWWPDSADDVIVQATTLQEKPTHLKAVFKTLYI